MVPTKAILEYGRHSLAPHGQLCSPHGIQKVRGSNPLGFTIVLSQDIEDRFLKVLGPAGAAAELDQVTVGPPALVFRRTLEKLSA